MISKWGGQNCVNINEGETFHVTETTRGINVEVVWPIVLAKIQMIPFILVLLYLNWTQLVCFFTLDLKYQNCLSHKN